MNEARGPPEAALLRRTRVRLHIHNHTPLAKDPNILDNVRLTHPCTGTRDPTSSNSLNPILLAENSSYLHTYLDDLTPSKIIRYRL